jgi:putative Holliday junction resolvase
MLDAGLKKKARQNKGLVDEISATIILQSYMESRRLF